MEQDAKRGELQLLIQLVCKKLKKGKNAELIAEELEAEIETVKRIFDVAVACDMDMEKIYNIVKE